MWFKNFTPPKFKGSPFPGGHFQVPCWTSWCSLKYFCPNAGLPVPQFPQDTCVARPGSRFFLGAIWQWPMACGSHEEKAVWRDSKRGGEKSTQLDHNWCMCISWIFGQFCFDLRDEQHYYKSHMFYVWMFTHVEIDYGGVPGVLLYKLHFLPTKNSDTGDGRSPAPVGT